MKGIRRSPRTTAVIATDIDRWFAAEWKSSRDIRMIEARVARNCQNQHTLQVLVRAARHANHEFIRYMRKVQL